jgi:hypothetical protein
MRSKVGIAVLEVRDQRIALKVSDGERENLVATGGESEGHLDTNHSRPQLTLELFLAF